ncbi:zinc finger MYM-type protein 1-like isoform X1 [Aphis craccivora]|uniref:Zinc finger MYM-type protein 1-like isoform X1 n=1 Tax=Aphis craccivora TaxID=307492 RepID=A0A6G0YBS4_APHCR|nr:zinc finger MYM-type protein 1-like isoform X1 [Aphis craccivora]
MHCVAHSLNLAVSKASNIQPIRNCLGIIEKKYNPEVKKLKAKIFTWKETAATDASILIKALDSEFLVSLQSSSSKCK